MQCINFKACTVGIMCAVDLLLFVINILTSSNVIKLQRIIISEINAVKKNKFSKQQDWLLPFIGQFFQNSKIGCFGKIWIQIY